MKTASVYLFYPHRILQISSPSSFTFYSFIPFSHSFSLSHIYIYIYIYIQKHTHTNTHTHTHTHTYIYIYIYNRKPQIIILSMNIKTIHTYIHTYISTIMLIDRFISTTDKVIILYVERNNIHGAFNR